MSRGEARVVFGLMEWLQQYIRNTFNAAKDGMSINGMDSREMEAEVAKAQEGEGETRPWCSRARRRGVVC